MNPRKAPPDRLLRCPICKHTILYCDGEPTPAILYRFGTRTETSNETRLGTPIGCERCLFAYKRRAPQAGEPSPRKPVETSSNEKKEESQVHTRPSRARKASPPLSPEGMPRQPEASRSGSSPGPFADENRTVKQMLREDVGGVVELLEEGVEVFDRARSFIRKIIPKP
jgi:hypothetical protein